ncbi:MAG: PilZ domain-containing protein [Candidatus Acidiferrales bacterium]
MADSSSSSSSTGTTYATMRTVPRYTFVGVAEVTDTASQKCTVGKIAELSRKGCFVDTTCPLPLGTPLKLVISTDQDTFATNGKVIYVREATGMGVAFVDPSAEKLKVLDAWLASRSVDDAL